MKLRCHLFGHKSVKGYGGCLPYFTINASTVDGIGRNHAWLMTECERCGEKYYIGMVHLPVAKAK